MTFYDVYNVCRLMTFVACDVCRIMTFVGYDVCRIMTFVSYDVCRIMMFVAYVVFECVTYRVCHSAKIFVVKGNIRLLVDYLYYFFATYAIKS